MFQIMTLYHQTKILISFLRRQRLNHRSLIQPSETLLVELIETQNYIYTLKDVHVDANFLYI